MQSELSNTGLAATLFSVKLGVGSAYKKDQLADGTFKVNVRRAATIGLSEALGLKGFKQKLGKQFLAAGLGASVGLDFGVSVADSYLVKSESQANDLIFTAAGAVEDRLSGPAGYIYRNFAQRKPATAALPEPYGFDFQLTGALNVSAMAGLLERQKGQGKHPIPTGLGADVGAKLAIATGGRYDRGSNGHDSLTISFGANATLSADLAVLIASLGANVKGGVELSVVFDIDHSLLDKLRTLIGNRGNPVTDQAIASLPGLITPSKLKVSFNAALGYDLSAQGNFLVQNGKRPSLGLPPITGSAPPVGTPFKPKKPPKTGKLKGGARHSGNYSADIQLTIPFTARDVLNMTQFVAAVTAADDRNPASVRLVEEALRPIRDRFIQAGSLRVYTYETDGDENPFEVSLGLGIFTFGLATTNAFGIQTRSHAWVLDSRAAPSAGLKPEFYSLRSCASAVPAFPRPAPSPSACGPAQAPAISPSVLAVLDQESIPGYNSDTWHDVWLPAGAVVWTGASSSGSGSPRYFGTVAAERTAGADAQRWNLGYQIAAARDRSESYFDQYRPALASFRERIGECVAESVTHANPQYGPGGLEQYFVPLGTRNLARLTIRPLQHVGATGIYRWP